MTSAVIQPHAHIVLDLEHIRIGFDAIYNSIFIYCDSEEVTPESQPNGLIKFAA